MNISLYYYAFLGHCLDVTSSRKPSLIPQVWGLPLLSIPNTLCALLCPAAGTDRCGLCLTRPCILELSTEPATEEALHGPLDKPLS